MYIETKRKTQCMQSSIKAIKRTEVYKCDRWPHIKWIIILENTWLKFDVFYIIEDIIHHTSVSERKHEIACTSWSSCLWKLCELVSNIEEQLCIVFMYTGNLSIISTISQFESDSKMCIFHLIWSAFVYDVWTTDLGFCQVSHLTHFPWQG